MTDKADSIVVRDAERADLAPIAALAAKLVRLHHAFDKERFMLVEPLERGYEHFFAGELADRDAVIVAAVRGDQIVGYAYGRLEARDWNALLDACGALHDIYVDESARGQGVARALTGAVMERLLAFGAPRVVLGAAWKNAEAQRFFESIGFRKTMVEMTREMSARDAGVARETRTAEKLRPGDRVAILTSGGDAPGMNAALRAAAKVGHALGLEVLGVDDGYVGLMDGRIRALDLRALDDAARRGGTVLGTARSKIFPTAEGQHRAKEAIAKERLRGLVVIGGNGSLTGARTLRDVVRVVGIPASIDNDLACTSMAIGVDTAMNTIVEACDRICDTATAHRRTFILEVMGRDSGYLAMTSAIAAGADCVLVREVGKSPEEIVMQVVHAMESAYAKDSGKRRVLVIKAEGVKIDSATLKAEVDARIATRLPDVDSRVTVLGHVVRGGSPSAFDRLLGARLANTAMRALADGATDVMAGMHGPGVRREPCKYDPYVVLTPLDEVLEETERLMSGESELARWRKHVFEEVETILTD